MQRELGLSRRAFPLVGDDVTLPSDPMAALAAAAGRRHHDRHDERGRPAVCGHRLGAASARPAETLARYLYDADARDEAETLYAPLLDGLRGDQVALTHLIATEHSWAEPARRLAALHAAAGGRSYLYEFGWASSALDGRLGAGISSISPFCSTTSMPPV